MYFGKKIGKKRSKDVWGGKTNKSQPNDWMTANSTTNSTTNSILLSSSTTKCMTRELMHLFSKEKHFSKENVQHHFRCFCSSLSLFVCIFSFFFLSIVLCVVKTIFLFFPSLSFSHDLLFSRLFLRPSKRV